MKFRALSFDCYGTLIDWERGIGERLIAWGRSHGAEADGDDMVRRFFDAQVAEQRRDTFHSYRTVLRNSLASVAEACGIPASERDCDDFASSAGSWPPFDDTVEALKQLAAQGRCLCVISNIDRDLFARTAGRLERDFDIVITAQDVESYKPNLPHFETLLGRLSQRGITEESLLHVAHSRFHDIWPANRLGWKSCRVARHGDSWTPEETVGEEGTWAVTGMSDVVELLDRVDPA